MHLSFIIPNSNSTTAFFIQEFILGLGLQFIQELLLDEINDFESLPEKGLRNLVSLRKLNLQSCNGLVSLAWIGSLTSLQFLVIGRCQNLTSLPQEIRNLTSLKELRIYDCALLGQRCKRQIGEDWPFIAHVPTVLVDWQDQQEETISSGMHLIYLSFNPKLKINY